MEALGAIVFLPADEQASPLFLQKILFDPAALWLAHALKAEGVERFLVVCDDAHRDLAGDCLPADTLFVTTGSRPAGGVSGLGARSGDRGDPAGAAGPSGDPV